MREDDWITFARDTLEPFHEQWAEDLQWNGLDGVQQAGFHYPQADCKRAVLIVPGRMESYIRYLETSWELHQQGYGVFVADPRGQGRSARLLGEPDKGHVEHFDDYLHDLEALMQQHIQPAGYEQLFLLGHSMGGLTCIRYLQRHPNEFVCAAVSAPMLGIRSTPMPRWMFKGLASLLHTFFPVHWAPGKTKWTYRTFNKKSRYTHSRDRWTYFIDNCKRDPQLRLGGPTIRWVHRGLSAGRDAHAKAADIHTPFLMIQAGADRIVDNGALRDFYQVCKSQNVPCELYVSGGARHEILQEADTWRKPLMHKIFNYFAQYGKQDPT